MANYPEAMQPETQVRLVHVPEGHTLPVPSDASPLPRDWIDPRYYNENGDLGGEIVALIGSGGNGAVAVVDRRATAADRTVRYWITRYSGDPTSPDRDSISRLDNEFGVPVPPTEPSVQVGNDLTPRSASLGVTTGSSNQFAVSANPDNAGFTIQSMSPTDGIDVQLVLPPGDADPFYKTPLPDPGPRG